MSEGPDPRLDELASLVLRLAGGEYAARGLASDRRDEIDALAVGLNLLAETLQMERRAREHAEALLHDSVHAYEHAPAMFCSVEAESLRIVKCNVSFAETLGLSKEQLLGRSLLDFVSVEERPALVGALSALRQGRDSGRSDFTLVGDDGRSGPVLMSASSIGEKGHPDRIRVILRDVSEERSLEAQLRQAQKMEAVGRLASGVAHDFNNILTVVLGAAELLGATLADGHPGRPEAEMILDAGERAAGLTRQLLAFGRSDLVHPRVQDVNALILESHAMLKRTLFEHARLELDLCPASLPIRIDTTQLTQVLLNLTLNARDAMQGRGVLRLRTEKERPAGEGGRAVIWAVDSGSGMTDEVIERAFEPFFTTKEASQGSGLGLAVCYGIVRQAGGSLELTSRPGQGTSIRIAFPLAEPAPARPPDPAPSSETTGHGERVLVVDDTEGVLRLMCNTLSRAGYVVIPAADADAALAVMADGGAVDLLVTDVVMPGTGGPELVRALWRDRPHLPVILVSGYTGERLEASLLARPQVGFLQKPFRGRALEELAHELLAAAQRRRLSAETD